MTIHKKIILSLLAIAAITLGGCKKFLAVAPNKGTGVLVSTTADLDGLLNNYAVFAPESTGGYLSTDDYNNTFPASSGVYSVSIANISNFNRTNAVVLTNSGWASEWTKIFQANLVLNNLSKVSGSDADKAALNAEAHFVRAYSYFQLANVFCLPNTSANAAELGLPLKQSTSFDESTARASLSDTYKFIAADLAAAEAGVTASLVQNGKIRNWRANTAAVHCFAARFYLSQNNYQQALTEANTSLAAYSTLTNYNNSGIYSFPNGANGTTINIPGYGPFKFLGTSLYSTYAPGFPEYTYLRYENSSLYGVWTPPTQQLLDLYKVYSTNTANNATIAAQVNSDDLRTSYNYVPGFTSAYGLQPYTTWPGYITVGVGPGQFETGPSVAEAMLIKAECQARTSDVTGSFTTVNALRVTRFKTGSTYANLVSTPGASNTQQDAITQILQERRRELPFGLRYYDMRRLNSNSDTFDDITVTRSFYAFTANTVVSTGPLQTYTLTPGSRYYAYPIPQNDIIAGNGSIQQNTY